LLTQLGHIFEENKDTEKDGLFASAKDKLQLLKVSLNTCLSFAKAYGTLTADVTTIAATTAAEMVIATTDNAINNTSSPQNNSIEASSIALVDKVQNNHFARLLAMKEIKSQITLLCDLMHVIYGLNKQIIILVDELDRCRPTYAVEMLEVIKHFFETKGCVFLIATDTEALQHSVNAIYGTQFKSEAYLKRFFNRKIRLSDISILDYLKSKNLPFDKYEDKGLLLVPFNGEQEGNLGFFAALFSGNKLELRDIEQALQQFFASLDYISIGNSDKKQVISTVVLMVGIVENMLEIPSFQNRTPDSIEALGLKFGHEIVGYDMYQFISLSLELAVKTSSYTVHSNGGGSIKHGGLQDCLFLETHNFTKKYNETFKYSDINKLIEFSKNKSLKYWVWEDYKKIIELSGYIE
jgi:hypothetical protein